MPLAIIPWLKKAKLSKSLIKLALKTLTTLAALVLVVYFIYIYIIPRLSEHESRQKDSYTVKRVIDGDTFEVDAKDSAGNYIKVRMLGVDTPEKYSSSKLDRDSERTGRDKKTIQRLGELSSAYTKKFIEGKKVRLAPEPGHTDKDRYGRILRYVYLDDGTLFNKKIIQDGYAYAYRQFPISMLGEFENAEREARSKKRGLWGEVEGLEDQGSGPNKDKR